MSTFDQASLVMIPSGYKTSKIYSVKPSDGTGDLTFTRTGDTASRIGPDGLIEKVRTNVALYSEQFDNAYWTKYSSTITANTSETTDPLGGNAADIFVSANATTGTGIEGNVTYTSGVEYTVSVYCKYKNTSFFQLLGPSFVTSDYVNFNIQTGAIVGGSYSRTPTITSIGNGWYRCSFTFVSGYTGTTAIGVAQLVNSASSTRGQAFTGDGVKAVYIFGAQFETGVMTDYIATTSSAVSVGPVANVPRLDYLGSSCPRLLLEPQRTNSLTYSEAFDNAAWTKLNATISANTTDTLDPSGYNGADKITDDTTNGAHIVYRLSTWDTTQRTASVYAKAGTASKISIQNASTGQGAFFDLSTGTITALSAPFTATITAVGNGWYRLTTTHTAGSSQTFSIGLYEGTATYIYAGTGSYAYIWGAQLEAGAYATSYIPTLGAAVTRGADSAIVNNSAALPTAYPFTLFVESKIETVGVLLSLLDSSSASSYYSLSYDGQFAATARPSGTSTNAIGAGTYPLGTYKVAGVFTSSSVKLFVNGALLANVSSPAAFNSSINDLLVGQLRTSSDTGQRLSNSQTLIFKSELSDADAIALTA